MNAWVCPVGKGAGLQEARWEEGMPELPLPNTSTDEQGLGQRGHPGGRGRLPPRLPAGGPGHRAGRVHIRSCSGDPGRLSSLPRPTLAAPVAPTVNQSTAQRVFRVENLGGCGSGSIQQWDQAGHPLLFLSAAM